MGAKRKIRIAIAVVGMVIVAFYAMMPRLEKGHRSLEALKAGKDLESDKWKSRGYLVYSPRCKLSEMPVWHNSIRSLFLPSISLRCSKLPLLSSVTKMKNGTYLLKIEQNKIKMYKKRKQDAFFCCYSEITRVSENFSSYDSEADNKVRYSDCHRFENETLLSHQTEFIMVKCMIGKGKKAWKEAYANGHALVPVLPDVLEKMRFFENNLPATNNVYQNGTTKRKLSVAIIGIDSLSRVNARRMMPNTFRYLKSNQWIEFEGYTKIGENTFPNLIALLSGMKESEFKKACYHRKNKSLDDCPFLWKQFGDRGYITAYAEDTPQISTFNYHKIGFVEKPTDYYLRPFMYALHSSLRIRNIFSLPVCVGPAVVIDHILDYARHFFSVFNQYNHFSLFWMNGLSHNNPKMVKHLDFRILKLLKDLMRIGTFNNTMIILLSDHGPRFGDFRQTFLGYYEERLPFVSMWIPLWFRKKYFQLYDNMVMNQKRLTTPYDLHLTLKKILTEDYHTVEEKLQQGERSTATHSTTCSRCISLFDPIPEDRNCYDAAIDPIWCMCNELKSVSENGHGVSNIGLFVRDQVEGTLKTLLEKANLSRSMCETWTFRRVLSNIEIVPAENNVNESMVSKRQFIILVELNPAKTKFEAVVEVTTRLGELTENYTLVHSPTLISSHFKFSQCVKPIRLKYYCYCKKDAVPPHKPVIKTDSS